MKLNQVCWNGCLSRAKTNLASIASGVPLADFQKIENYFLEVSKPSDDSYERKSVVLVPHFIFFRKVKKGSGTLPICRAKKS